MSTIIVPKHDETDSEQVERKCVLIAAWEIAYHVAIAAVFLFSAPTWSLGSLVLALPPLGVLFAVISRKHSLFVPFLVYNFVCCLVFAACTLFLCFALFATNTKHSDSEELSSEKNRNLQPHFADWWTSYVQKELLSARDGTLVASGVCSLQQMDLLWPLRDDIVVTLILLALSFKILVYFFALQYYVHQAFNAMRAARTNAKYEALLHDQVSRLHDEIDRLSGEEPHFSEAFFGEGGFQTSAQRQQPSYIQMPCPRTPSNGGVQYMPLQMGSANSHCWKQSSSPIADAEVDGRVRVALQRQPNGQTEFFV